MTISVVLKTDTLIIYTPTPQIYGRVCMKYYGKQMGLCARTKQMDIRLPCDWSFGKQLYVLLNKILYLVWVQAMLKMLLKPNTKKKTQVYKKDGSFGLTIS